MRTVQGRQTMPSPRAAVVHTSLRLRQQAFNESPVGFDASLKAKFAVRILLSFEFQFLHVPEYQPMADSGRHRFLNAE